MNEGWASYWHEKLFLMDDRIKGHEVDFARVHSAVTSLPRVGLNPYALGMRMFYHIEEMGNKGTYSIEFKKLRDARTREKYDAHKNAGQQLIFGIRENYSDSMFISTFIDQDFVTRNNLFVTGKRLNNERMVWEYYVKSRKADDYRAMLQDNLYHPPHIEVDQRQGEGDNTLHLVHMFESKPLVKEYIANTMLGIEYLWGGPVELETNEVVSISAPSGGNGGTEAGEHEMEVTWQRVLYTMKNRKLQKRILD
jgi:stage V sporulation protein R